MAQRVIRVMRGFSLYHRDSLERKEISVDKKSASFLPCRDNLRIPIKLCIGKESYEAGMRTTANTSVVWICPDLRDGTQV